MNAPPSPTPPGGEVTVGELGRWLNRVDKQLTALTDEIRDQRSEYVHRTEWDLARAQVEHLFEQGGKRIDELAADIDKVAAGIEQRRPQWTAIISAVVAALALALTLLQAHPTLLQGPPGP